MLWPDFDETVLDLALADYAVRERRFGVRPLSPVIGEMLRQRIITGLILAGALLATLAYAPHPLQAMLFALVAATGAWEGGASWRQDRGSKRGFAVVVPLLCFLLWQRIGLADQQPATEAQPWLAVSAFFLVSYAVGTEILSLR